MTYFKNLGYFISLVKKHPTDYNATWVEDKGKIVYIFFFMEL